jgi:hypothetical protein
MGGVAKGAKKAGKAIKNVATSITKVAYEGSKKLVTPSKWLKDNVKMPAIGDAPLMPDYEMIDKDRRRRRSQKMGRVETIMSDSLG